MSNMSMNSEKTAPLMALRRFSCLSAVAATNPEDSMAVIGVLPKSLSPQQALLCLRLASLLWIKQMLQSGNQLFPLTPFQNEGGRPPKGIDHATLAQPFKFLESRASSASLIGRVRGHDHGRPRPRAVSARPLITEQLESNG